MKLSHHMKETETRGHKEEWPHERLSQEKRRSHQQDTEYPDFIHVVSQYTGDVWQAYSLKNIQLKRVKCHTEFWKHRMIVYVLKCKGSFQCIEMCLQYLPKEGNVSVGVFKLPVKINIFKH